MTTTEGCDQWTIALEKEARAELSRDERQALEEHLAACARCRAERSQILHLAEALSAPGQEAPSEGRAGIALRAALVLAMVGLALRAWFRVRPRLIRELAALEGR